ncbi:RHS repeat-associated core domain-containing protein [Pseudomonas abietaniphila]|uniref:RHS repeat-associated core domain-containing protein n=1 Tax=Pseudomonas abietaniphila TaxID=89065 RepID=UPI00078123C4|nr:RHS repeat-associated core domain-containing protein [Pseudomonas abietaniphila]
MMTSECLHLHPYEREGTDPFAGSSPSQPDPLQPLHGSKGRLPQVGGTTQHSAMQSNNGLPPRQQPDDPPWKATLLGTDQRRTVLHKSALQDQTDFVYTPYGYSQDTNGLTSVLGLNGERREAVTGHYLLGAGYRAFNPVLMRFNSPDSLSPFGEGGLNPYAYCVGDPVNFVDPSGHLPEWAMTLIGIGGGVLLGVVTGGVGSLVAGSMAASTAGTAGSVLYSLGMGLEIASVGTGVAAVSEGGEKGGLLGKISMGLGFASGALTGVGLGMKFTSVRMKSIDALEFLTDFRATRKKFAVAGRRRQFDQSFFDRYKKMSKEDQLLADPKYEETALAWAGAKGRRGRVPTIPLSERRTMLELHLAANPGTRRTSLEVHVEGVRRTSQALDLRVRKSI